MESCVIPNDASALIHSFIVKLKVGLCSVCRESVLAMGTLIQGVYQRSVTNGLEVSDLNAEFPKKWLC